MCVYRSGGVPGHLHGAESMGQASWVTQWWIKSRTARTPLGVLVGNWRNDAKGTEIGSFPAEFPRKYEYLGFISTRCILYGFSKKLEAEPQNSSS